MTHLFESHRQYLFGITLLFFSTYGSAQTTGHEIIGTWWNQEKEALIEIYQNGVAYSGKIVWLKEPNDPATGKPKLDKHNPDPELQSRPLLGSDLLHDITFDRGEKEWSGGTIYDGREGKRYKCYLALSLDGTLKVRGYLGASWMGLGKTNTWTRKTN